MLDSSHSNAEYVYKAAALIDGVMRTAQQMTVSPSAVRVELLSRCLPMLQELRIVNSEYFGKERCIAEAIDEYEVGVREVAALGQGKITEDRRSGDGHCPYCGGRIVKYAPLPEVDDHFIIYCDSCSKLFMPAKEKLASFEGFGTDFI
jgi:hypothetical protein